MISLSDFLTSILSGILCMMLIVLWTIYWRESQNNNEKKLQIDPGLPWPIPHKRISDGSQYNVAIIDGFIGESMMKSLRKGFPADDDPKCVEQSKISIGSELAEKWNSKPDESYYNQGIIIDRIDSPEIFNSNVWFDWVSKALNLKNPIRSCHKWQYHTYKKDANGIWLHTDQFSEQRDVRSVLVLMYVHPEWDESYGGKLKIFQRRQVDESLDIEMVHGYQYKKPMDKLKEDIIRADTVGGEASADGIYDFHTAIEIDPKPNRIVLIDHTNFENIHGLLPCHSNINRLLVQQWLSTAEPIIQK